MKALYKSNGKTKPVRIVSSDGSKVLIEYKNSTYRRWVSKKRIYPIADEPKFDSVGCLVALAILSLIGLYLLISLT